MCWLQNYVNGRWNTQNEIHSILYPICMTNLMTKAHHDICWEWSRQDHHEERNNQLSNQSIGVNYDSYCLCSPSPIQCPGSKYSQNQILTAKFCNFCLGLESRAKKHQHFWNIPAQYFHQDDESVKMKQICKLWDVLH